MGYRPLPHPFPRQYPYTRSGESRWRAPRGDGESGGESARVIMHKGRGARVASSKERQRKLARAKYERQMARKAASARKSRQIQAGVAAGLAVLLIALGSIWLLGGFESDPKPAASED